MSPDTVDVLKVAYANYGAMACVPNFGAEANHVELMCAYVDVSASAIALALIDAGEMPASTRDELMQHALDMVAKAQAVAEKFIADHDARHGVQA